MRGIICLIHMFGEWMDNQIDNLTKNLKKKERYLMCRNYNERWKLYTFFHLITLHKGLVSFFFFFLVFTDRPHIGRIKS